MAPAFHDDRIGTTLKGKWHVDARLGQGGMASVYAGTHRNGKRVAIKLLHPELARDAAIRDRFVREGYVANKVGHEGAVVVDDDDVTADGAPFLVMELLDGETLEARRMRYPGGRLPIREVVAATSQILETLSAAHAQGIVHRDLKPENLFLTRKGVVKVLDFGIARVREGSVSATASGSLIGTPAFLPPEQARGRSSEIDGRTDLWAIGATMFTLLAGRHVHHAEIINDVLLMAMTEPAPPLASVAPDVPPALAAVVDRALARERNARWPDASAMREAMLRAEAEAETAIPAPALSRPQLTDTQTIRIESPPAPAPPTDTVSITVARSLFRASPPRSRAKQGWLIAAAVVGTMGIGGAGWFVFRDRPEPAVTTPTAPELVPASSPPPAPTELPQAPASAPVPVSAPAAIKTGDLPNAAPSKPPAAPRKPTIIPPQAPKAPAPKPRSGLIVTKED